MKINNLEVKKSGHLILKGLHAEFETGKTHIIMGPNGSGKSTLSYTIAGHTDCEVIQGEIYQNEHNLIDLDIEERSLEGIYLAPQYPPVIEGLSHAAFLKEAVNVRHRKWNKEPVDDFQFLKVLRERAKAFNFDPQKYPRQSLNSGFSGGERKRNEILQISLLEPSFVILDEIDSGLDIEAMQQIAQFIVNYKNSNRTIVAITHYPQFAELLKPDYVHILKNGNIVEKGDASLIMQVNESGFGDF